MEKYNIDRAAELGWILLVAVIAEAGQLLAAADVQEVLEDPKAWGITFAAALGRVVFAVGKNAVLPRIIAMFGNKGGETN